MGSNTPNVTTVGERFDKWTVLSDAERRGGCRFLNCVCDCGAVRKVAEAALKRRESRSCGCLRRTLRTGKGVAGFRKVLGFYKKHARQEKRSFTLTEGEFKELTLSNCYYCGGAPANVMSYQGARVSQRAIDNSRYTYNGVDRVDTAKGYDVGNVVACCKTCNFMKGSLSYDAFMAKIKQIGEHRGH